MVCLLRLLLLVAAAGLPWLLPLPFPLWRVLCSCSVAFSFLPVALPLLFFLRGRFFGPCPAPLPVQLPSACAVCPRCSPTPSA